MKPSPSAPLTPLPEGEAFGEAPPPGEPLLGALPLRPRGIFYIIWIKVFPLDAEQPLQRAEKRASVERSMTAAEASSRLAEGDLICYRHFEYSSQCTLTGAEPARLTRGLRPPTDARFKPPSCGLIIKTIVCITNQ